MKTKYFWILLILSAGLYFNLGYFTLRSNFTFLIAQVFALFILFYFQWKLIKGNNNEISMSMIQWSGIFLRILLLFHLPNLSDDFFRFLWDGQLINHGANPYLHIPSSIYNPISYIGYDQLLYEGLNSKAYFSIYPPFNQFIFSI